MTNRDLNQALLVLGLTVLCMIDLWLMLRIVFSLFGVDYVLPFEK